MKRMVSSICLALMFSVWPGPRASAADAAETGRSPQWPLKTSRVLLADEQIARARRLCEENADARKLKERILDDARYWVAMSDQVLHDLLPDSRVARAFDTATNGCPAHGNTIYRHGTYPWKLDREHPFTIICPEGGERYPSNDFDAYYRSGMKDASLLTGPYADSGRGWVGPDGEKYWLVAYACHWHWRGTWLPAVTTLAQAYTLTGEAEYARKAIVMLDRIAEIYPGMDYASQSRYGELREGKYYGKILNAIWETAVLTELAVAYDQVFPALVGDAAVSLPWRSAEQIRANIEANLLEEGLDAIEKNWIHGNYGMHQNALAHAALVRQNGPMSELIRSIFETTGKGLRREGLNYALYNAIYKDGMPYESSPNYAAGWLDALVSMARPLAQAGFDLYAEPKMRRVFDAPLELICAGDFTPAIGDSGGIDSHWIPPNADVYEAAYRRYHDPRYAWALSRLNALREDRLDTFEKLFKDSIVQAARADAERYHPQPRSRLLDGFGVAILNNPSDRVAVSAYYGVRQVHSHQDTLNIELFGLGRRLSPDLGYPDQTDHFHSGIFSWTQNTISHNCLIVDRTVQQRKDAGNVLRMHDSPTVHVVDIDAAALYERTDVYRRTLVLVDADESYSYLVDVFRVRGGKEHVLSLHGAEGKFSLTGAELSPPVTEGTLAGRDVKLGQLYDDPVLGSPDYRGSYKDYMGSGYSHFFNWQRARPDAAVVAQWAFPGTENAMLRVHIPPSPGQEMIVADAYVSPTRKIPAIFKYVLLQRPGSDVGNTFVTIWEPVGKTPMIDRVEITPEAQHGGSESIVTLTVHRGTEEDVVCVAPGPTVMRAAGPQLRTDAAVVVCTREGGSWTRLFAAGGTSLLADGAEAARIPETLTGRILSVDYNTDEVVVETDGPCPAVADQQERPARLYNPKHSSVHRVTCRRESDRRLILQVRDGQTLTGRLRVSSCDPGENRFTTSSQCPHGPRLHGMHLLDGAMKHVAVVAAVTREFVEIEHGDGSARPAGAMGQLEGQDVWVADFGPGDRIEIEGFFHRSVARRNGA